MLQALKGFAGSQLSKVGTSVVGGLNQSLALEMSRKAPVDLYSLTEVLEQNPNESGILSLRERLHTIEQKPQYSYLSLKFREWNATLDSVGEGSIIETLESLKADIEQTIQKNTSLPEHLLKKVSDFLDTKLSLAPIELRQARRLAQEKIKGKEISTEVLKRNIGGLLEIVRWGDSDEIFLRSSQERIDEFSGNDWELLLDLLRKKELEISGPIIQHIQEIQLEFLFLFEYMTNQLTSQVHDLLQTPPFAISKSIFLIKHQTELRTLEIYPQLRGLLLQCLEEQAWSASEKSVLEQAVTGLQNPTTPIDWQNILLILELKHSVLSGKLALNAHHFKTEFLEIAEQLFKIFSTSLFRQGNPIRAQLDFCICYLRRASLDPLLQPTDQKFLDYLDQLNQKLNFITIRDELFHQARGKLCEVLDSIESDEFCPERFPHDALEVCQSLLPFFEDSGTIVKIFETFQSVFQGTTISWSQPAKHINVLPHTYSSNRLVEMEGEAGSPVNFPMRPSTPSEWPVLRQSLSSSNQEPYLKDLQVALQRYLQHLKGDIFKDIYLRLDPAQKSRLEGKKDFKALKKELLSDFDNGSSSLKHPLKHLLLFRYDHLFSRLSDLILNTWLPNLHETILEVVDPANDSVTVEPLEKLTTTFRQFSIDLDEYSLNKSPLSREKFLKNRRMKRQGSITSYFRVGWSASAFFSKKISAGCSLSSILETILDKSVIPFDRVLEHSLVWPFVKTFDFIIEGIIQLSLRVLLTFVPFEKITDKLLDRFITTDFLHRTYRSVLELYLEDYRSKLETGFNSDLGKRVDPATAKEFLMSLMDVFEKSKGMDPRGLQTSYLQKIPAPLRLHIYDSASKGIQTAWENLFSLSTVNKTFDSLTATIDKKTQQYLNDSPDLDLIGMSDQDLEHALARHLVNDLFAKKDTAPLEAHFEQLKQYILDLPTIQDKDAFIPAFNILKKAMADGLEKIDPVVFGKPAEILSRKMRDIEYHLLRGSVDLESSIEDLRQSVAHLRFEALINQDFRFKDMAMPWFHKTIETVLISVREIMTEKELIKRILMDQLYPE
jgi:hypothetical protein